MYSVWTKHLQDAKQITEFKSEVSSSKRVLDRAIEILKEEKQKLDSIEFDKETYNSGYPYLQAHLNGMRSAYDKAIDILTLDQRK